MKYFPRVVALEFYLARAPLQESYSDRKIVRGWLPPRRVPYPKGFKKPPWQKPPPTLKRQAQKALAAKRDLRSRAARVAAARMGIENRDEAEKCLEIGRNALRRGDSAKAVRFFAKSLSLHELPGVAAARVHSQEGDGVCVQCARAALCTVR